MFVWRVRCKVMDSELWGAPMELEKGAFLFPLVLQILHDLNGLQYHTSQSHHIRGDAWFLTTTVQIMVSRGRLRAS